MGTRGPAPKSKHGAIAYKTGIPKPPDWLSDSAKEEYKRAAEVMGDSMTHADLAILATYADAYSEVSRLSLLIREQGDTVKLNNGVWCANPLCAIRDQAARRLQSAGAKLGFSPVDRARVPKSTAEVADEFSDFVK